MPINQRQLAAALLTATHIAERHAIAAFVNDAATQPAPNPFAQTSAGAVRQVWRQRAAEFHSFDVEAVGLACPLTTVSGLSVDEELVQEILRAGPHTANVFHQGRWLPDRRSRALWQAGRRSAGHPCGSVLKGTSD